VTPAQPPPEVLALVEEREHVRANDDWPAADSLRDQLAQMGWQVLDTPSGPRLEPLYSEES
jgi:cysteinyl-tRNA synthetase